MYWPRSVQHLKIDKDHVDKEVEEFYHRVRLRTKSTNGNSQRLPNQIEAQVVLIHGLNQNARHISLAKGGWFESLQDKMEKDLKWVESVVPVDSRRAIINAIKKTRSLYFAGMDIGNEAMGASFSEHVRLAAFFHESYEKIQESMTGVSHGIPRPRRGGGDAKTRRNGILADCSEGSRRLR